MASGIATVKQVISGDTVVLVGPPRGGPPPEKQLTLASIIAPRVAMKSLTKEVQDEPYGWNAREFLRQLVIGKQVEFKVEYTHNNKEHGWIKLAENGEKGESVSYELLRKGLVKLKPNSNPPCAGDYEELEKCQEQAKEAKVGVWSDEPGAGQSTIRDIKYAVNDVALLKAFVDKNKNKKLKGIVEYVRDGGCVRVLFTEEMIYCSVLISGIQCDGFKRETDENNQDKIVAEPFAAEAKFFVEFRLLNRDVEVRVETADDYGNMYGSIYHPNGNIALLLLSNGFAKIQDWSARLTESTSQLREAVKTAQNKQLRKWKNWQPEKVEGEKEYEARVREVISGDCLVVVPSEGVERRLYLASIRCPKLGGRTKEDEPYAFEAKEVARKNLTGKKVKIVLEYIREPMASAVGATPPPGSDSQGRMHFVSVYLENDKNISEILVTQGLAKTVPHRADDKRAENFDTLLDLEKEAASKKIGVHSDKTPPKHRINDLTGPDNAQRARSFEAQLAKIPKITGIVDVVFHAGRYKIRIPSENLWVAFVLSVVKCPQTARPGSGNKANDPFAEEAAAFAKDTILQREVTIKIESADRRGNFFGFLWLNKKNFAVELLEQGYASITNITEAPGSLRESMNAAEQKAKAAKLHIWSVPGALENGVEEAVEKEVDEIIPSVRVTHIDSILSFYIQETTNTHLGNIMKQLLSFDDNSLEEFTAGSLPRKGDIVLAKFSMDEQWYRARVESREGSSTEVFSLLYIDFGNSEHLPLRKIRRCPKELHTQTIPPQAKQCALAGTLQPVDMEDEAAQYFHDLADGKIFNCKIEKIDKTKKRYVILTEQEVAASSHGGSSVNELIMRNGLARLDKRSNTKIFSRLQKEEEAARKAHINVWRYGDVGDDEENFEEFPSLTNKRVPGPRK